MSLDGFIEDHHRVVREALDTWRGVENDTAGRSLARASEISRDRASVPGGSVTA
jgi:hypothetical protein